MNSAFIILFLCFSIFCPYSAWGQSEAELEEPILSSQVLSAVENSDEERQVSDPSSVSEHNRLYSVGTQDITWQTTFAPYFIQAQVYFPMNCNHSCPVVIYSHGLGGTKSDFSYLAVYWASRGLVVFLLEHSGSNESVWRGKCRPLAELKSAYQLYWSGRDRAQSINFVITQIQKLSHSEDELGRLLNSNVIGVAGNDLGALGALLVSGQLPPDNGISLKNEHVKAVLALSPPVYTTSQMAPLVYSDIDIPFMSFSGTKDNGQIGTTKSFQRRIPYDSLQHFNSYHVTLYGADHQVYGGHQLFFKQKNDAVFQHTIKQISMIFWGAWLLNDQKAQTLLSQNCSNYLFSIGIMEHGQIPSDSNVNSKIVNE